MATKRELRQTVDGKQFDTEIDAMRYENQLLERRVVGRVVSLGRGISQHIVEVLVLSYGMDADDARRNTPDAFSTAAIVMTEDGTILKNRFGGTTTEDR